MPWPSGSIPVMKVDHATGLCGGVVVCSGLKSPWRRSRARLGSALQCCWTNCGSIPSTPRTMTRGPLAWLGETPQPAARMKTPTNAHRRNRSPIRTIRRAFTTLVVTLRSKQLNALPRFARHAALVLGEDFSDGIDAAVLAFEVGAHEDF